MITCNNHEHGRVYSSALLKVDIDNRERFFTVYDMADKPVATIIRPRMYDRTARWEAFKTDGTLIGKAMGARAIFCHTVVWHNKTCPAPITSVGGNGLTGRIA